MPLSYRAAPPWHWQCTGTHKNKPQINNAVMAAEEEGSADARAHRRLASGELADASSSPLPFAAQRRPTVKFAGLRLFKTGGGGREGG